MNTAKKVLSILSYHNAVPLLAIVLTMGTGVAFAATDPQAVFSTQEKVVTIDNTYIANVNLDSYTPKAQVITVTEDAGNYYIAYSFSTIALKDATWQDVQKDETLTVSKAVLSPSQDLGVYVTQQLKEKIDSEIAYLKKVQEFERKSVTQKQIATAYGGLIGKLLNDKTETLAGYTPVVTAPAPQVEPVAPVVVVPLPSVSSPASAAPAPPDILVSMPETATTTTTSDTLDATTTGQTLQSADSTTAAAAAQASAPAPDLTPALTPTATPDPTPAPDVTPAAPDVIPDAIPAPDPAPVTP